MKTTRQTKKAGGFKMKTQAIKKWSGVFLAGLVLAASLAAALSEIKSAEITASEVISSAAPFSPAAFAEKNHDTGSGAGLSENTPPDDAEKQDPKYICKSAGLGKMVLAGGTYFYDGVGSANDGRGAYLYYVADQLYVVADGYWEVFE